MHVHRDIDDIARRDGSLRYVEHETAAEGASILGKGKRDVVPLLAGRRRCNHAATHRSFDPDPPAASKCPARDAIARESVYVPPRLGHAKRRIGVLRNVVGGTIAMAITYGIGTLVGTAV